MKNAKEYQSTRRQKIIGKLRPNEALFLLSPPLYWKTSDQHHEFRQSSDMLYLTGWERESSAFILSQDKTILFIEKPTPMRLLWDGHVPDIDEAKAITGIQDVRYKEELETELRLLRSREVFYELGKHMPNDKFLSDYAFKAIKCPRELVGGSRLIKDEWELDLLRKSCDFSARAHEDVWKTLRPGMNEAEFARELEHAFKLKGSDRNAYGSIVASGANATCLHYILNNKVMNEGDLLLVDAAGEYKYYASDITRTFPVKGWKSAGTDEQNIIYKIVLDAQLKAIESARAGLTPKKLHQATTQWLEEGLTKAGILKDKEHMKKLYPHGTGHWLGLDVHDECPREIGGEEVKFAPGMVLTVEPGLYFYGEMAQVYPKFAGIGIRIEDDVVITDGNAEVMTSYLHK